MTKIYIKEFFKHNIPILIHHIWKNKFEAGFFIFGLSSLLLTASLLSTTGVYTNNNKELQEAREQNQLLAKELRKYYLLERDLIEAGASNSQARDIIKSTEMLDDSNLARTRLGK